MARFVQGVITKNNLMKQPMIVVNKSGGVSLVESSKRVKPWRQDVKYAALEAHEQTCGDEGVHFPKGTPVCVSLTFYTPRPQSHYGTGRNAQTVKASAPAPPATKPDLDKLVRSTLDALGEAGMWADDGQVTDLIATARYADNEPAGCRVELCEDAP